VSGRRVNLQKGFVDEAVAAASAREKMVLEALSLLIPYDLEGERKKRFGALGTGAYAWGDGTYVLVDRCRPPQDIVSFGVGPIVSFELEMAERGHRVFLFDHTVQGLPAHHERFTWFREGVCAESQPQPGLSTLASIVSRLPTSADAPILKMDIEGAEWAIFAEMPVELLCRFEQIALEVHHLDRLEDPQFNALARRALDKLAQHFTLCHVHANNYGFVHNLAGTLPVAETLELTYLRSDLARPLPSKTLYPTIIDFANYRTLTEIRLWFYPFMPGSEHFRADAA